MSLPIVRVHRKPGAKLPILATSGSAAMDVSACLEPDTVYDIPVGERMLIPTGLSFEIPIGFYISLRPRSGLALKSGISIPNAPATIDADYRGELLVLLHNAGSKTFRIEHGDRIAQLLLEKMQYFEWQEIEDIDREATQRATGGFGSTGLA